MSTKTRREMPPLLLLNLAHGYDHFFLLIFPTAVLGLQQEWQTSYADLLALGTAMFATFVLATLPAGWLGDRWERAGLMTVFFFGLGGTSVLTGLAGGPIGLALGLALMGLFAAIYHPVATALIVQATDRPGRALGVNGVFGNLGVALAPVATGGLIALAGWRAAFIVPGIVAIVTGLVFAWYARGFAGRPIHDGGRISTCLSGRVRTRVLAVVALSAVFGGVVFNATTIALPKVFEERLASLVSGIAEVGLAASLVFAVASLAQIAVGRALDHWGARPLLLLITGLQVPCLMVAAGLWGGAMLAVAFPLMLLVFGEIPITAWLVGRHVAGPWRSRIYAVEYTLSLGVSAAVVPMIAVLHGRTGGFEVFFLVLAGAAAVVFAAAFLLPREQATPSI